MQNKEHLMYCAPSITVSVHDTSLANQNYIVHFWGGGMEYEKRVLSMQTISSESSYVVLSKYVMETNGLYEIFIRAL